MGQTSIYFKIGLSVALTLIISGLVMACGTAAPTPMPRTPTAEVEMAKVPPPTPITPATATPPPAIMAPDDGCVDCHSNQELLIATAKEEEVVEALSEGEG